MKISRLKPLLRTPVAGKTRLRRNLLIFMLCCAVKPCWFIPVPGRYSGTLTPLEIQPFFSPACPYPFHVHRVGQLPL